MQINRVTITGADDSVKIEDLVELSGRYPFVEWGILLSKSSMGRYRFPSKTWLGELLLRRLFDMRLAGHVCGSWVRNMVRGGDEFLRDMFVFVAMFQRLQWNFHAEHLKPTVDDIEMGLANYRQQNILQMDGVNDRLFQLLDRRSVDVYPLFDTSGGAGIVPKEWPKPFEHAYCGYAGGLGPDTLEEELKRIEEVAGDATIWIDMERRVRSADDSKLDIGKVEQCLMIAKRWVR